MWQAKYACSWAELWITKWYEDGTFKPGWSVTALEAIAFSTRAFEVDVESLWEWDEWYEKYQAYAHINNLMPIHSYWKDRFINRGQAADLINRMRKVSEGQKIDYASTGCSIAPSISSGSYNRTVSWIDRNYLLYVPPWMQIWKQTSLIVAFHGRTNSNQMVRDYMKLWGGSYGQQQWDFVVAYPAGMWPGPYSWSQYANIEFFDAIVTELSEKLCIDRDAVFSVGHSLGSYMSNKVSCQRWNVIRAMVWVASSGFNWDCSWPVSSLITHLPGDPLASYAGGQWAYALKSKQNFCSSTEINTSIWDIRNCTQKTSCTPGNTVLFCNEYATYGNDLHGWPKNWADDILDFFRDIDEFAR
jgi:polyhydroxybutyrate depolymerase